MKNQEHYLFHRKDLNFAPIAEFMMRDLEAAGIAVTTCSNIIASAYFPDDSNNPLTEEVKRPYS